MATILLADDAKFVRVKNVRFLTEQGHTVYEAEDGVQAVALYEQHRPQVVLLDHNMPNMEGIDALKAIRALDPNACVAMVTAAGEKTNVVAAIMAGAKDFVVKPYDNERLAKAVETCLAAWSAAHPEAD